MANPLGIGGRPRIYDEEFFDDLSGRLETWVANKYATFKKNGTGEIWLGDFALENGFSRQMMSMFADSIGKYSKFNMKFVETWGWAMTAQESWAIFDEKLNFGIRKLVLTNHHRYQEKLEVQQNISAPSLPGAFAVNFNFYLEQMGQKPVALPAVDDGGEAEVVEEPANFGESFKQFADK